MRAAAKASAIRPVDRAMVRRELERREEDAIHAPRDALLAGQPGFVLARGRGARARGPQQRVRLRLGRVQHPAVDRREHLDVAEVRDNHASDSAWSTRRA
jgi:hypothetical protein